MPPRAILALVHGLGGHSGLFKNIVECLVPQGYAIYGLDLRGNGRSPGQRGHINRWSEFRTDVGAFLQLITAQHPETPQFLLGHSLGGAVVLEYALRFPEGLQGIIVTAPALGRVGVSALKFAIALLLSRIWPTFSLSTGIDLETGVRDPAILAIYDQDPLRHHQGSARLATEYLATVDWLQAQAHTLQLPLLMLQGGADRVALPESSREFFDRVTFADKEWHLYPESYHELYDDLDYPAVLTDLADWLERHL
jgi:alpha-beta hydrolase superfamily lysophospholipase